VKSKVLFCLWVLLSVLPFLAPRFTAQTSHAGAKEAQSPSSTHPVKSGAGAGKGAPDGAELPRTHRRVDPAFFISVEQARAKLEQRQAITLIDVRRAEEVAKLRIPGSINMPLIQSASKVRYAYICTRMISP
jgi:Rhodanese-like domain